MIASTKKELLSILEELSKIAPEVRFGQLIVNLSYLAKGLTPDAAREIEDDELLAAAREHLEQWRVTRGVHT
jgi:hypothetical protein